MAHTPIVAVLPALDGVVLTAAGVEAFDCPVCGCARDLVVAHLDEHCCGDDPEHANGDCVDRACGVCGLALTVGVAQTDRAVDTLDARRTG